MVEQRCEHEPSLVVGVFVGGSSQRMGGEPKGLLCHPSGGTLVEHAVELARTLGAGVVLVGKNPAYERFGVTLLADIGVGMGPIAGLRGLLRHVEANPGGGLRLALALAGFDP